MLLAKLINFYLRSTKLPLFRAAVVDTYVELCQNKVLLSRILNSKIFEDSWDFKKYDSLTNVVGDVINKIVEEDMKELNSVAVYQFVGYEPIFGF